MHLNLVIHNPTEIQSSPKPQHSCLFFLGCSSVSGFYLVVHQPCDAETRTCLQPYNPFHFIELALGRLPIFTRRSRAGTSQIISARLSKNGPLVTFASDTCSSTHFYLVKGLARKVWRHVCSGFCARSLGLVAETATGLPCEHWAFFFPLITSTLSSFNVT